MNPTTKTTNKGYWTEGTVVNGTNIGGGKFVQGTPPEPISKTITMDDVNTTTNLIPTAPKASTTPYTPTVTAPSGMAIGSDGTATYTPPSPKTGQVPEPSLYQKALSDIGMDIGQLEKRPEVEAQLQEQQQLAQKTEQATKDYNTYNLRKREIEKKVQELQAQTGGKTTAGVRDEVEAYTRKANSELADLAIQAQASQGLLTAARQTIKDTIDAQFAPIEDRIARRTQYAQLAANDLTESEKYKLDQLNKKDEANQKEVSTYATSLANTVFENGAPVGVRTKIFNIAGDYANGKITKEQAQAKMMEAAGTWGVNQIDQSYKQAQIDKMYADTTDKKSADNVISKISAVDPNSSSYLQDIIAASAGGAKMTGDQINPISKALTVVGQIDSLQKTLEGVKTDPILGILKSANPYDIQAQLVKGQLQALIPNLARGIYGEVGVLTDNDIANYRKTIGNLKSPEKLNDLLLSMTLTTVKNSISDRLEVAASAGRDVSGFKNLYNRLDSKIGEINNRIGITNGSTAITVSAGGNVYTFPDQKSADAFKKAANIK